MNKYYKQSKSIIQIYEMVSANAVLSCGLFMAVFYLTDGLRGILANSVTLSVTICKMKKHQYSCHCNPWLALSFCCKDSRTVPIKSPRLTSHINTDFWPHPFFSPPLATIYFISLTDPYSCFRQRFHRALFMYNICCHAANGLRVCVCMQ